MDLFDDNASASVAPRRSLSDYLEIPLRRPWHVIYPFVVIVGASLVWCRVVPKKYYAYTSILVESEKVPTNVVPKGTPLERSDRRMQTIRQDVMSGTRLEQVLKDTNPYPESGGTAPITDLVEQLRSNVDVAVRGSDSFSIGCVHTDPQKAAEVVNRLAALFVEETTRARSQQVEDANVFLDAEVAEARRNLDAKEGAVRRFKEEHMGTLPEQSTANLSTLQRLQQQAQAVGDDLRAALTRQGDLEKQLADVSRGGTAPGLADGSQSEILELRKQLASLRARYTDEHPDVRRVLSRLSQLESRASAEQKTGGAENDPVVTATELRLEQAKREAFALQAKQHALEERIAALQGHIDATPRTEQELTTLTRDSGNLKENYFALLNKKLEAQMAAKLEERWRGESFRILDPARVPDRPFFPNQVLFVTIGIVVGLFVGLGIAMLADMLDHSFKSLADVETLPYPVLSAVPYLKGRRR
jgi:polysaccharide chain length determinant protein (PEP-CTERM system associated)